VTGSSSPYAIVDFPAEPDGARSRLCFAEPRDVWRADTIDRVGAVLDEADRAARTGRWVVGFVSFEATAAFDPAFDTPRSTSLPLAWFAEFIAPSGEGPDGGQGADDPRGESTELAPETTVADERYAQAVGRIHEYIDAGDVYQVNLTVPFTAPRRASPRALYERMRRAQGGAYSCLLDIGDARILSASPELFFERRGDRVRSRPMKGTAPRGVHPAADITARDTLLASEKERAENVMIVDLMRNDLSRVCELGSVAVTSLLAVESYPAVHQLVSEVEGRLRPGLTAVDALAACFPAGSMTGAPKIRATQILDQLEAGPRGLYAGTFGFFGYDGQADLAMIIRSIVMDASGASVGAGGGITTLSVPEEEYAEMRLKAKAPLAALGLHGNV